MWRLLKQTVGEWIADEPFSLAAALSYYALFSLAPLLIIAIAIAGLAFGSEAAQNQIVETIQGLVGKDSARAIQELIQNAGERPKAGLVATVFGIVTLLFGAGGVVGQLQTSLNKIWGVELRSGQGAWMFIRQRFISFAMVLSIGFLLLVSLVMSALVSALSRFIGNFFGGLAMLTHVIDIGVSFVLITMLFALIYKFLPDARIRWKDVWIGAALTSILFTIGKSLIGLYLGNSGVASVYGAAGSLITVLLWIYYSSLIFFLGAELTQVYAAQFGSGVVPSANARAIDRWQESREKNRPGLPQHRQQSP